MDGMDGMDDMDGVDDDLDLEVEVSDLRRGSVDATLPAGQPAGDSVREGADAAEDVERHGTLAGLNGEGTPTARPIERAAWHPATQRTARRRMRGYAVAALVVLVFAGLLLSLPGTQQALRQALVRPTATPTASLAFGANLVAFEHTAPWGHLTLDGTAETPELGQFGQFTPLPRGRHTLTYAAAPWPVLRCQLSVPAQEGDSCPVDAGFHFGNEQPLARVIDLGATADRLPAVQRAALTSVIASALQESLETTAVPQGDHYRAADGHIAVATQPIQAHLTLTLNTDATGAGSNVAPGACVNLCSQFGVFDGGSAWWIVWANVAAHWWFVAADGTRIDPGSSTDLHAPYSVGAMWSGSPSGGSWSATAHPYAAIQGFVGDQADLCFPAFQQAFPNGTPPLPSMTGFGEAGYLGQFEVEGCVVVVSPNTGGGPPAAIATPNAAAPSPTATPLPADAAIFIVRFGMVLAGNAVAHTAQPTLPVASAHEEALAQQWMTQPQP